MVKNKPLRSKDRTAATLHARERQAAELAALGNNLETTLRRIGAYLAWVHRDLNVIRTHVTEMRATLHNNEVKK